MTAAGADVDQAVQDGGIPLHVAALKGHERVVKALLAAGTSLCTPQPPTTARHPPPAAQRLAEPGKADADAGERSGAAARAGLAGLLLRSGRARWRRAQ